MQFIDLKSQYHNINADIDKAISDVLEHGRFIMGPEVKELENALCEYTDMKYCISCANGTDALKMVLMALNLSEGDAVFTTAFSFFATAEVIAMQGATPVFVDIDIDTFNIDSNCLKKEVQRVKCEGKLNPKAIITVDLFGLPADYDNIKKVADEHNLFIIEDGAQGFGGEYHDKKACSLGNFSTTSFFPAKPLGCYGDGGAVFTNDDEYAKILSSIRVHGKGAHKYDNVRLGLNSRLDTIQAAILLQKFKIFDTELKMKNELAQFYLDRLCNVVKTSTVPKGLKSAWAQYSILTASSKERCDIQKRLKENDIPSAIYYITPLPYLSAFQYLGYKRGDFPMAELASNTILSLPMHAYMDDEDKELIASTVLKG